VCEATFQDADDPWTGHLSAAQAGTLAAKADAARLVLTHLPPGRDHARTLEEAQQAAGSIPVELAEDRRRFDL
jgi:ribonuclease BN (tRNA processing enzyme)